MEKLVRKYGNKFGASRFVAGESIEEAVEVIKALNAEGFSTTIDYLGEFVADQREADMRTDVYLQLIEAIEKHGLNSHISIKLTALGLDIDDETVKRNVRRIVEAAEDKEVFVTIDMEDFSRCGRTLELFKELRTEFTCVGTVLQAYLYRTMDDLKELQSLNSRLRLVKGAYKESPQVAFQEKQSVDENFRKLIKLHLLNGHFTAVATHDEEIIGYTKRLVDEHQIPCDRFEFQMLYGIRRERQRELLEEGYKMRVYVPFGKDWYGYFMRRMAERPENAAFVFKGLFRK